MVYPPHIKRHHLIGKLRVRQYAIFARDIFNNKRTIKRGVNTFKRFKLI